MSSKTHIAVVAASLLAGLAYGYTRTPPAGADLEARRILAAMEQVRRPPMASPADSDATRPLGTCATGLPVPAAE